MELSPASPNISYVVVQTSWGELDGPPYEFVSRATAEAHLTADGSMPIVWQRMVEGTLVSDDTSIFGPDGYRHPSLLDRPSPGRFKVSYDGWWFGDPPRESDFFPPGKKGSKFLLELIGSGSESPGAVGGHYIAAEIFYESGQLVVIESESPAGENEVIAGISSIKMWRVSDGALPKSDFWTDFVLAREIT